MYEEEAVDWLDTVPYKVKIERNVLGAFPLWEVGIWSNSHSGIRVFYGDSLMEAVKKAKAWWERED